MKKSVSAMAIVLAAVLVPAAGAQEAKKATPLPKTGLTIELPAGAKVSEAMISGADSVDFKGMQSGMVVKPRLAGDKELEALEPWAKKHEIQKFVKEILKEGKGTTYTYMYTVDQFGTPKCVYHQMFQVGGKTFVCFSNANSEADAKVMKAACDTIKK